jgi:predicted transcriptional regulator
MTSLVSVRMNDELLRAVKTHAHHLHVSQTDYIRTAIEHMNAKIDRQAQQERLRNASLRVRKESMQVNAEFSEIEYDPDA